MPYADPQTRKAYNKKYGKEWSKRNRVKKRAAYSKYYAVSGNKAKVLLKKRAAHYLRRYDLTLDQLHAMQADQCYRCKLCDKKTTLVVDHCHKTGRVRGLLCHYCNRRLGMWEKWTEEGKFAEYCA